MLFMTLLYISYIAQMHFYDTPASKSLEIVNECFFLILQYNLVILTEMVDDYDSSQLIAGYLIIGLAGFLLAINLVIIMYVSIKGLLRKF